jgi:hypothetical protein
MGIDVKGFKPNLTNGVGWLGGARFARYLGTSQVSVGLAGYYGVPTGGSPSSENMWYAGPNLGQEGKLFRIMVYEIGIMAGAGAGKFTDRSIDEKSYYVIEPNLSTGFNLGGGIRLTFSTTYIHMTGAGNFSGPTFGFRFDYRTQTSIKELTD